MKVFLNLWILFIGIFLYTLAGKLIVSFFEFLYEKYEIYFGMSTCLSCGDEYCPYNYLRYLLWPIIAFVFTVFELPIIVCILIPLKVSYYFLIKRNGPLTFSKFISMGWL